MKWRKIPSPSAEWLATFREDLESAFSLEAMENCVVKGRDELPSSTVIRYHAFCDPSGGRVDSFTLSIAHKEEDKVVVDCIRDWRAPLNPYLISAELSAMLKAYGLATVSGDNFAGQWPVQLLKTPASNTKRAPRIRTNFFSA